MAKTPEKGLPEFRATAAAENRNKFGSGYRIQTEDLDAEFHRLQAEGALTGNTAAMNQLSAVRPDIDVTEEILEEYGQCK